MIISHIQALYRSHDLHWMMYLYLKSRHTIEGVFIYELEILIMFFFNRHRCNIRHLR